MVKEKSVVLPLAVRPSDEDSEAGAGAKSTALYSNIDGVLKEWQDHRKVHIEGKWKVANSNFQGSFDDVEHEGSKAKKTWRSKAFYPLTEQKVTAAQAQLQDVLFKGGRFPYDIKSSPIPDDPAVQAEAQRGVDGEAPVDVKAVEARAGAQSELEQRVKNMKRRMNDQFAECDAASVGLNSLYDGALYGTAFLESPRIIRKKRYKWKTTKKGDYVKSEVYEDVPTVVNLDPWDCWPDPECGGKVENGIGFFYRERMSAPALYDLFDLVFPDKDIEMKDADSEEYEYEYNRDQFEALLNDISESDARFNKNSLDNDGPNAAADTGHANKVYDVYNFAGSVQNLYLKDFIDLEKGVNEAAYSEVIVVMCKERIIKCVLNPFPGRRRPYHMVPWTSIPGSSFGRGVAEKIFDAQKNVNRLMRMYIDNKRLSGNLMTAIDKSKLARGTDLSVHPGKNWEFEGSFQDADVRKLMQTVVFPDVTAGVLDAIGTMVAWADQSSGVPKVLEGQPGQDSSTAYAENQRIAAATKQLGLVLKNYDMYAWVPIVESFYDWNMQYLKDNSVKGDFEIIATGFSTFENKHLRKLDLERFLMLSQQLPALQMKVKSDPIVEDWALAANLDPERYLLNAEQVSAKMSKQQEDQLKTQEATMVMEQQKANMEHQFEMEVKRMEQDMSGQIRIALAGIEKQNKEMAEQTKRLVKLADIESKEKQNGRGQKGSRPNR